MLKFQTFQNELCSLISLKLSLITVIILFVCFFFFLFVYEDVVIIFLNLFCIDLSVIEILVYKHFSTYFGNGTSKH